MGTHRSSPVSQNLLDLLDLLAFLHRIFELAPGAVSMYSFGSNVHDEYDIPETLFAQPVFQAHTRGVVKTLETALVLMLGHDMGTLALALQGLGARHVTYGVQPAHYGIVETALLRTLAAGLGEAHWTMELRKDWAAVFKFVAKAMGSGASNELTIVKEEQKARERRTDATIRFEFAVKGNTRWETTEPQAPNMPIRPSSPREEAPPREPRRHSDTDVLSHEDMDALKCEEEERQHKHEMRLQLIIIKRTRWEAEQPQPCRKPAQPSRTREDSPPGMPRRHSDTACLIHLNIDVLKYGEAKEEDSTDSEGSDPRQRGRERRLTASAPHVGRGVVYI
jgi:hypothetical protein